MAAGRLRDLAAILAALERAGMTAEETRVEWVRSTNRAFQRVAPIDLVARDDGQRVLDYIETLS